MPWIAAQNALQRGEDVRIFYPQGVKVPQSLQNIAQEVIVTKLYASLLAALRRQNVRRLVMLGKFPRELLYNSRGFDLRTLWLITRAWSQSDYSIFKIGEKLFKHNQIEVLPQTGYLQNFILPEGRYGKKLNWREVKDVLFGIQHAKALSQWNIGQTVVVGNCAVLALEAVEGSDRCIRRGGQLFAPRKGAVVCKVARDGHDIRNDMPTIGLHTLKQMQRVSCRVLALDATCSIVVELAKVLAYAKKYKISIVSVEPKKTTLPYLKHLNAR